MALSDRIPGDLRVVRVERPAAAGVGDRLPFAPQAVELLQRRGVGVDAQVCAREGVGIDHQQCGRAQRIDLATRGKSGRKAGKQPVFQPAGRLVKAFEGGRRHIARAQEVAQSHHGVTPCLPVNSGASRTVMGADASLGVDHGHLSPFRKRKGLSRQAGGGIAAHPRFEQRKGSRADHRLGAILCDHGADACSDEWTARADGDARGGDRHAEASGLGASCNDRVGHRFKAASIHRTVRIVRST
jgi:hypothetical protein